MTKYKKSSSLGKAGSIGFTPKEAKEIRKNFIPVTNLDHLALYLYGTKFSPESFDRFFDSNLRKKGAQGFNLRWIKNGGAKVDQLALSIQNDVQGYNVKDESEIIADIQYLITTYPAGFTEYYFEASQHNKDDYNDNANYSDMDNEIEREQANEAFEDGLKKSFKPKTRLKRTVKTVTKTVTKRKTVNKTKQAYTTELAVLKRFFSFHNKPVKITQLTSLQTVLKRAIATGKNHMQLIKTINAKLNVAIIKLQNANVGKIKKFEISKDLLAKVNAVVTAPQVKQVTLGGLKNHQKQYNKEVDAYKWFVVELSTNKPISGFEFKQDAIDLLNDFEPKTYKIVAKSSLKKLGIGDPSEGWKKHEFIWRKLTGKEKPSSKKKSNLGSFSSEHKEAIKEAANDVKNAGDLLAKAKKNKESATKIAQLKKGLDKYTEIYLNLLAKMPKKQGLDRSQTSLFKTEKKPQTSLFGDALHGIEQYTKKQAIALGIIDNSGNNLAGIEPKAKNPYDVINRIMIKQINKGVIPWEIPWSMDNGKAVKPMNFGSKREYRGVNFWSLICEMDLKGHEVPYFLTSKQIADKGGKLEKSAKPYYVTYYGKFVTSETETNKETGQQETEEKLIKFLKLYVVYNIEDTDLEFEKPDNKPAPQVECIEAAEAILNNMPKKPKIKFGGNQAFYRPSDDLVQMPKIENFKIKDRYYSTFFHELVHSTKDNKRCGSDSFRKSSQKFADKQYSWEELVAELGACYLCGEAGILHKTVQHSAAYAKSWANSLVKFIGNDKTYFFKAANYAQKAADFILNKQVEKPNKTDKTKLNGLGEILTKNHLATIAKNAGASAKSPFQTMDKLVSGGTYQLAGERGKLLGNIGQVDCSITIRGDQGAGKSQLMWQLVDDFAEIGKEVAVVSPEMNGSSPTISSYRDKYIKPKNQNKVLFTDKKLTVKAIKDLSNAFDVVFVDSFNQLENYEQSQFDWLCKELPNKCIVGLFQSTTGGEMRGGNKPEFDAYVNIEVVKVDDSFVNNYAVCTKNRFGGTGAKYNISTQKIMKESTNGLSGVGKTKPAKKTAKKVTKSVEASKVLKLMDDDYGYQDALKLVLSNNKNIDKTKLEKELNKYI